MDEKNDVFTEIERIKQENIFLRKKIEVVSEELNKKIAVIENKLDEFKKPKESAIQHEVIRKLNRNKKEIIKHKILEMLQEGTAVAEAKENLVDQQNYCSKATFYRYVDELKLEKKIFAIQVNNEERFI